MAAKVYDPPEKEHFDEVVQPAIDEGIVTFLGELGPPERDALYAGAAATLMLGAWPEPFGLVAIESMATGTPIIGRRAGALTETVEHGLTGLLVDDLTEAELAVRHLRDLSREAVRARVIDRFRPGRMVDAYEAVYRRLVRAAMAEARPAPTTVARPQAVPLVRKRVAQSAGRPRDAREALSTSALNGSRGVVLEVKPTRSTN
jgi:hypothetical protein